SMSSRPLWSDMPRLSRSRSALAGSSPPSTDSPSASTAPRTSYGGSSGSGPPRYSPYLNRPPSRPARSATVDGAAVHRVLRQPAHQVKALECELERRCCLAERLAAIAVEAFHDLR